MEPDVLFTVALLLVLLHSAWVVEPSVGLEAGLGMDNVGFVLDVVDVLSTEVLCYEGMLSCFVVVDVVVLVDGCDSIICWCN